MKRLQGYKFCINPKQKHLARLNMSLGANRFVWNRLLQMNLHRLKNKQALLWYHEMAWFIKLWKSSVDYDFLNDAPSQSLQQTAKALDRAFRDAFDKNQPLKRIPKIKRLNKNEAGIKYPQGFKLDQGNHVIKLPKLGWIKYRGNRKIVGAIKNVTISRKLGKYYIAIQTEREVANAIHPAANLANNIVGIDMGIINFATLSTGVIVTPINSLRAKQQTLKVEQRKLKHKIKFSHNWQKQQRKICKIHTKISDIRHDFLHKVSTQISKNHAIIVLENLQVANMSKSAKGSLTEPGRMVKQKSGLNKAILDQGWSEFRRQLEYKQNWLGGRVIMITPQYTSQTCPNKECLHICKENRKTQAVFHCVKCGYSANADVVGAINTLRAGLAQIACEVSASVKVPATGTISVPLTEV